MSSRRYVEARVPWKVRFDPSSRAVRQFLAGLMDQSVSYGMPGIRRYGVLQQMASALRGPHFLASSSRAWRKIAAPDIDAFLGQLEAQWDAVRESLARLPAAPPEFHGLLLERKSAGTLFVFGNGPQPLLVAKLARADAPAVQREHLALRDIAPLGIAPQPGPRVGEGWLQEALPGRPPRLVALSSPESFEWTDDVALIAEGVLRLAERTGSPGRPIEADDGAVERALAHDGLPSDVRAALRESLARWKSYGRVVLKHGDLSPQNCLLDEGRLSGIVDWATTTPRGSPCFDHFNLGMSVFEHRVFLRRRTQAAAAQLFDRCWQRAPYFKELRGTAAAALLASGVEDDVRHTALVFFGRRFGQRVKPGASYALGEEATLKMLVAVARSH